jgi:hypothetical protein
VAESPDRIQHRRHGLPSPVIPIRAQVLGKLPVGQQLASNEELAALLKDLIGVTERATAFSATVAWDWLLAALIIGGYAVPVMINVEGALLPGATVTVYVPVPPGYTFYSGPFEYWSSLPWWLSTAFWVDSDLPAPPAAFFLRFPDRLEVTLPRFAGAYRFFKYTVTNNHAVNTVNFLAKQILYVLTLDTDKMLTEVYISPIIDYIRAKAEEVTGRPFP